MWLSADMLQIGLYNGIVNMGPIPASHARDNIRSRYIYLFTDNVITYTYSIFSANAYIKIHYIHFDSSIDTSCSFFFFSPLRGGTPCKNSLAVNQLRSRIFLFINCDIKPFFPSFASTGNPCIDTPLKQ